MCQSKSCELVILQPELDVTSICVFPADLASFLSEYIDTGRNTKLLKYYIEANSIRTSIKIIELIRQ